MAPESSITVTVNSRKAVSGKKKSFERLVC